MPILIACGTLIDGTGRAPVRNARLLVDGDRIAAVGTQDVSRLRDVRFVMKGGLRQDLSPL